MSKNNNRAVLVEYVRQFNRALTTRLPVPTIPFVGRGDPGLYDLRQTECATVAAENAAEGGGRL